ncbi:MAG: amino acid--tRNA ligase-related protein [Planctomycetia bacterium]
MPGARLPDSRRETRGPKDRDASSVGSLVHDDPAVLELRERMRGSLRGVLHERGFLEVDTPVLSTEVLPEPHIDPITVEVPGTRGGPHYLQASPEALMKRLLAAGSGAIYQFARSFRAKERGRWHDVEFVMLEWYEPGATLDDTATLVSRLCGATLGTDGLDRITCTRAFMEFSGVDPLAATLDDLAAAGRRAGLAPPPGCDRDEPARRWDAWFELLLAEVVSPRLGHDRPAMLESWPVSQAAFARVDPHEPRAARRFELIVSGVELANGWEEETSREVLETRITDANRIRTGDGRPSLPPPARLLAAHGPGMPEGVGAALGFDRLVMLAAAAPSIDAVRCFTSED